MNTNTNFLWKVLQTDNNCVCRFWTFKNAIPGESGILPVLFLTISKTGCSAQERWFLHVLNCLWTAYGTDGFLYSTLVDMTTLSAMLMVPDQFINSKILATARGTHDTSLTITSVVHSGCLCGLTVFRTVKITSQKGPDKDLGTIHFTAIPAGRFPRFIITVIA